MISYILMISITMQLEPNVKLLRNSTYLYTGIHSLEKCNKERDDYLKIQSSGIKVSECIKSEEN